MTPISITALRSKTADPIKNDQGIVVSRGKRQNRVGLDYQGKQIEIALVSKTLYKNPPTPSCFEKILGKRYVVLYAKAEIKGSAREGYIKVNKKSLMYRASLQKEEFKTQIKDASNRDVTAYIQSLSKPKSEKKLLTSSSSTSEISTSQLPKGKYIEDPHTESELAYKALLNTLPKLKKISSLFVLLNKESEEFYYKDACDFIQKISKEDLNAMVRMEFEDHTDITTPLIAALQHISDPEKRLVIVQALIEKGADPKLQGITKGVKQIPIELVKSLNDKDLLKLFKSDKAESHSI